MEERVYTFLKSIGLKVNVIAQLEFEPTHYVVAVQHISYKNSHLVWIFIFYDSLLLLAQKQSNSSSYFCSFCMNFLGNVLIYLIPTTWLL